MYDQFYGLQGRPFQLTPDPHFYFESATHRKALSYLGYGLAQGEGFIVITGDIGAGKTTLVGHLMGSIDPARLTAVKIVSTQVGGDDMLRLAAQSFGVAIDGAPKAQLLQRIEAFLHAQARAGRRTLLIVDEAQNLAVSAIEELRMLSNFQLGGQALLQIFLLGQPEFRDLLKSPELEQLRQRVIATHHLEPMMAQEIEPYILHRLTVVGWQGNPRFTPEAFAAIYAATDGVPRRVNALASRVLLMGAIDRLDLIDADVVGAVVADMSGDSDARPEPIAPSVLDVAEEPVVEAEVEAEPESVYTLEPELAVEPELAYAPEPEVAVEPEPIWEPEAVAEPEPEVAIEPEPIWEPEAVAEPEPVHAPEPEVAIEPQPTPRFAPPPAYMAQRQVPEPQEIAEDRSWEQSWEQPAAIEEPAFEPEIQPEPAPEPVAQEEAPVAAFEQPVAPEATEAVIPAALLEEIAALRAEVAILRADQATAASVPSVDVDALVSHFTLIDQRMNGIEERAREQDAALRRVLTMLVDWVEREERMLDTRTEAA